LKKAIAVPVIATASEAWREAIQTFFRFFAAFTDSDGILSGLPRRSAPRNDSLSVFQQHARAASDLTESGRPLYLFVLMHFLIINRYPLDRKLL